MSLLANRVRPRSTVRLAAVLVTAGVVLVLFWRVPDTGHLDPQPATSWGDARLAVEPEPDTGPVVVAVHNTVSPDRQKAGATKAV